jgi:uncharacterized protein
MTYLSRNILFEWHEQLEKMVRDMYEGDATGHDYYHSVRVKNIATQLQKSEGGALDVLVAAAYLHDVGRIHKGVTDDHALAASENAPRILAEIGFPEHKRQTVIVCIRYHDHYVDRIPTEWKHLIELQIFQDADRLDAIGAIGIARTFTYGGATSKPIWVPGSQIQNHEWTASAQSPNTVLHFYEKLLKMESYLNTATAKTIAAKRIAFMQAFLDRFFDEWEGKK